MASPDLEQPPRRQYDCVCLKYGSGHLHKVSHTAWYQHLASACTEEEHQCIQTARVLADRIASLPPLTRPSLTPDRDYSVPPSVRRAEARQGLAKRARENRNPNEYEHDAPPLPPPPEEHDAPPPPPPEEHDAPPPPPNHLDQENRRITYQRRTRPQINIQHLRECIIIPKLKETMDFVSALSTATLADPVAKLGPQALERLRDPPRRPLLIDNAGHRHSISIYLTTEHSSQDTYEKICRSTARNFSG
ncbi:hypothetical protein SCLCIDRAFT_145454, partial [Scleroderma citrinum Foug A]